MEKENKIAAIYCRTATDNTEKSMDLQREQCHKQAECEGYKVVEVLCDYGASGMNIERSGLRRILRLAGRMEIDVVITANPERLSRNTADLLNILETLAANSIKVVFANTQHG